MPSTLAVGRGHSRQATSRAPERVRRLSLGSEDGQAVVELALILPVVLLILFGVLDFGRAINDKNTANHLANLGARFAAVGTIPSGSASLCQYIDSTAAPSDLKSQLGVVVTEPSVTVGSPVTVKVTNNYHWLKFLKSTLGISATSAVAGEATMRLENTTNGNMTCEIPPP